MKLEPLGELKLVYTNSTFGEQFVMVQPYGTQEGTAFGDLEGSVTGERLRGKVRLTNHPHRRSDGVMLPNAHGVIRTDDGAIVLFTLQGRTVFVEERGRQLLAAVFESEDERYKWLNNTFCVLEGAFDPPTMSMRARVYSCVSDLA
jgi:Protein of unknown function (DUF3237)